MSDRWPRLSLVAVPIIILVTTWPTMLLAQQPDSAGPSTDAKGQAAAIWESRCAACHGADGRGDGPGAASLQPKPVNFHNHNWQKAVTDDQIAKAIVEGGSAVGVSNQMPGNPDLEDEDGIVKALVAHVRELGKSSDGQESR